MKSIGAALAAVLLLSACGDTATEGGRTPSPTGAKVFFVEPADGATLKSPFKVKFGIEGMDVAPAGTDKKHSGHHHLLIDASLEDYASPIPADENYRHFGKGQTETELTLSPGQHTLQMILGDMNHVPHEPAVESEVITITVEP